MIDHNLLKQYRELSNLTTSNVAKKIKRSKKVIEDWELGNSLPSEVELEKLAKVYNVEVINFYYKEEKKKINIFIILALLIIGGVFAYIIKNKYLYLIIPLVNINAYISYFFIKRNNEITMKDEPKSLFNFKLVDNKISRFKLYLIESNIISSVYLMFDSFCEVFNFKLFIFNINILSNKDVNKVLVFAIVYLLLFIISFIIELVFSEYMLKKYIGDNNERQ